MPYREGGVYLHAAPIFHIFGLIKNGTWGDDLSFCSLCGMASHSKVVARIPDQFFRTHNQRLAIPLTTLSTVILCQHKF